MLKNTPDIIINKRGFAGRPGPVMLQRAGYGVETINAIVLSTYPDMMKSIFCNSSHVSRRGDPGKEIVQPGSIFSFHKRRTFLRPYPELAPAVFKNRLNGCI